MPNKFWKAVAVGRLKELRSRAPEIKGVEDILSAVETIEMPTDLKKELLAMPINLGLILPPPAPAGWPINTPEETIAQMIAKVRNYKEE